MSTSVGRQAEEAAAQYLRRHGFRILEQNWRTRWCEIDIVAMRGEVVYFVEVKYRRTVQFGSGLEYITPRKLQQMAFSAELWSAAHPTVSTDVCLAAVELTGEPPEVTRWVGEL